MERAISLKIYQIIRADVRKPFYCKHNFCAPKLITRVCPQVKGLLDQYTNNKVHDTFNAFQPLMMFDRTLVIISFIKVYRPLLFYD